MLFPSLKSCIAFSAPFKYHIIDNQNIPKENIFLTHNNGQPRRAPPRHRLHHQAQPGGANVLINQGLVDNLNCVFELVLKSIVALG